MLFSLIVIGIFSVSARIRAVCLMFIYMYLMIYIYVFDVFFPLGVYF